jgi:penicillin-binding protein 2
MGIDTMNKYSKMFGLGEATGIELGEATGILAGEEYRMSHGMGNWYVGDTIAAAIGQSDNQFTPIQISNYVATLLSGGTRYRVHLMDSVREFYSDEVISEYTPVVESDSHISSSTVSILMESMRSMVDESYTASTLMRDIPVPVGGKTGTAQTNAANDNGLFVCAAPYNDPDIVISVVIEAAGGGSEASYSAASVLEEFYN